VWRVGDDALTSKFRDALETAFERSSSFALSSGRQSSTLIVKIPTNLAWKRIGERIQVTYSVDFITERDEPVDTSIGSCWDDELSICADHVVKDAQAAAGRLRKPQG